MTQGPMFGPQSGNAATNLPPGSDSVRYGSQQTWVRDATAPGKNDGTILDSAFFNRIIGSLEYVVQATATVATAGDFTALYRALQSLAGQAVAHANTAFATLTGSEVLTNKTLTRPQLDQPHITGGQADNLNLGTPVLTSPTIHSPTMDAVVINGGTLTGVTLFDGYTPHGDSNYTILASDRVVGTNAAFTASRTWTLPLANAVPPGQRIYVADFQGGVSGANTLIISRAGSNTINGSTSVTLNVASGAYMLVSDGVSKWSAQAIGASAVSGVSTVGGVAGAVAVGGGTSMVGSTLTGTTKQLVVFSVGNLALPVGQTSYLSPSGYFSAAVRAGMPVPFSGTLKNLFVSLSDDPGNTKTAQFTVYVNGVATGITCTVTGNGSTNTAAHDTTHTAAVAQGDLVTVQLILASGASATLYVNAAFELDNSN